MKLIKNPLIQIFSDSNLINKNQLEIFHQGTRDIGEINILIDNQSGILLLDKCVHDLEKYYIQNENYPKDEHFTLINKDYFKTPPLEDDYNRFYLYKDYLKNCSILDFGCGKGGFLRLLNENNISLNLTGLEINKKNNENINSLGIKCLHKLDNIKSKYDFIFLNHVFEHLDNPFNVLNDLLSRLNSDGNIVIEIPHGNDFLIKKSGLNSFKDFTFWSEHLCLYTQNFINKLLKILRIDEFHISYKQRYNLNNHIHWFKDGKPGGHKKEIFDGKILHEYNNYLISKCQTDTLVIVIGKNSKKFCEKIFQN